MGYNSIGDIMGISSFV